MLTSPSRKTVQFVGTTSGGLRRSVEILIDVGGSPEAGDFYGLFVNDMVPYEVAQITINGEVVGVVEADQQGHGFVEVQVPLDAETAGLDVSVGSENGTVLVPTPLVVSTPIEVDDSVISQGEVDLDVLENDRDHGGDLDPESLRAVSQPASGTVVAGDGVITYTPAGSGVVSFVYEICDLGGLCAQATVTVENISPSDCTITGTAGDDVLEGTSGPDVICGLGGDDIIFGGRGADIIDAVDGDDIVNGGRGVDVADGGSGFDECRSEGKTRCET